MKELLDSARIRIAKGETIDDVRHWLDLLAQRRVISWTEASSVMQQIYQEGGNKNVNV